MCWKPACIRAKQTAIPSSEKYAQISDDDKKKVVENAESTYAWLREQLARQQALRKGENPVITCADLNAKLQETHAVCGPVQSTPKTPNLLLPSLAPSVANLRSLLMTSIFVSTIFLSSSPLVPSAIISRRPTHRRFPIPRRFTQAFATVSSFDTGPSHI